MGRVQSKLISPRKARAQVNQAKKSRGAKIRGGGRAAGVARVFEAVKGATPLGAGLEVAGGIKDIVIPSKESLTPAGLKAYGYTKKNYRRNIVNKRAMKAINRIGSYKKQIKRLAKKLGLHCGEHGKKGSINIRESGPGSVFVKK